MSSDVVAICCCGAGLGDCCDFWNQCDIPTPTMVTVTVEERVTRHWSTKASMVVWEGTSTWTAGSWTRGSPEEEACDGNPQDFYLLSTDVNWQHESVKRQPMIGNANGWGANQCPDQPGGSSIPPPPLDCSGCDEDYACREEDPEICEASREEYEADTPVPDFEARIECVVVDGCVRPRLTFKKTGCFDTICTVTVLGSYSFVPGCCDQNPTPIDDTASFLLSGFQVVGECGCLGPKSWLAPIGSPPDALVVFTCDLADPLAWNGTWTSDETVETLTWTCTCGEFMFPDDGSIINECSMEVRWHDVCERKVTVSVS